MPLDPQHLREIALAQVAETLRKDQAYASAFEKVPRILEILFPDGIRPEQYATASLLIRCLDKQVRLSSGESLDESPWRDLLGYALLGAVQEG